MENQNSQQHMASKDDFQMYYQHQYERMKELEQQRLTMTNVIIGFSILSYSLAFSDLSKLNIVNAVGLPLIVLFANIIAVLYNRRSRSFIKMHQARAHKAMKIYAPELEAIDYEIPKPFESDKDVFRRPALQNYLHVLMIAASILPIFLFLFRK